MSLGRGKPALITVNTPLPPLHKLLAVLVTGDQQSEPQPPPVSSHGQWPALVTSLETRGSCGPRVILAGKATANIYIAIGKIEKL